MYRIVRFYYDRPGGACEIDTGLTLEEAQAHCDNLETSSRTATSRAACEHTEKHGPWFDGYEET